MTTGLAEEKKNTLAILLPMKALVALGSLLLLIIAALAIVRLQVPPQAVSSDAPPADFSSGRAMDHIRIIAATPHQIGSAENSSVGDYIMRQLAAAGLKPEMQRNWAENPRRGSATPVLQVNNVLARLNGDDNTGAILLSSHYDSAPSSPGASDDGSGVASMLETLRALKSGPQLRNDIIFLFTDGEEIGLLGAKAFVDGHPWAKDVRVDFNFEARGTSGPVLMFETSANNGRLLREFAKASPHPFASSYMYDVYKLLPNDTDFTVFRRAGIEGLNFSFIDGVNHYHSPLDNLKNIDERSLQHVGSYALSLTRQFGNLDLKAPPEHDAVYFDLFGTVLIRYPQTWVVPIATMELLLFIAVVGLGFRSGRVTSSALTRATLGFLLSLVIAPVTVTLLWKVLDLLRGGNKLRLLGETHHRNLYIVAFVALTVTITSTLFIWLRRKISVEALVMGALLWWLVFLLLTAFFLRGGSYLFTWPLLLGLVSTALMLSWKEQSPRSVRFLVVFSANALLTMILLIPAIYLMTVGLSVSFYGALMPLVVLLLGLLIPHLVLLENVNKWLLPFTSLALFAGFALAGVLADISDINLAGRF